MQFNNNLFIIFYCICINFVVSTMLNQNVKTIISSQIVSKSENKDKDCEVSNLAKLSFDQLLTSAQLNEYCKNQANNVFKQDYGHIQVKISAAQPPNGSDFLYIAPEKAEEVLKTIGHSIKRLSLNYNGIDYKTVEQLIDEHCADTLNELEIEISHTKPFASMKKEFKKVESFIFLGSLNGLNDESLDLSKVFPELRRLQLNGYSDGVIFDRTFPHLIEFHANTFQSFSYSSFFQKNKQIKRLSGWNEQMAYLKAVHDNLAELETLELNVPLTFKSYQGDHLSFPQLKAIKIIDNWKAFNFEKITFGNLHSIDLEFNGIIGDDWIEFIASNKDLCTLSTWDARLNKDGFSKLSNELPQLVQASIVCDTEIDLEAVKNFVKSHEKMHTFTLTFFGKIEDNNELNRTLGDKFKNWDISSNSERINSFKMIKTLTVNNVDASEYEDGEEREEVADGANENGTEEEQTEEPGGNTGSRIFSINFSVIAFALILGIFNVNSILV